MRVAIYARVSAVHQDLEIQLAELRDYVKSKGWEPIEYVEKLSGKEGKRRPQLERLLSDAQNKQFEVAIVWKMDRFGRSALDALNNVQTLSTFGVRFLVTTQPAIDTDDRSPLGKFILQILASVAELERAFIVERTHGGQIAYRAAYAAGKVGKEKGRRSKSEKDLPVGRPKKTFDRLKAREMAAAGASIRDIAKSLGVGRSLIHEFVKQMKRGPQVSEKLVAGLARKPIIPKHRT